MWVLVHPIMLLLHSAAASEYAMHGLKWVAHPEAAAPSCCPPCSPIALLLAFRCLLVLQQLHTVVFLTLHVTTAMQFAITAWFCCCDHIVLWCCWTLLHIGMYVWLLVRMCQQVVLLSEMRCCFQMCPIRFSSFGNSRTGLVDERELQAGTTPSNWVTLRLGTMKGYFLDGMAVAC